MNDLPVKAVYRAIATGELVARRFNAKTIRIARSSLVAWLARCERRAVAQVSRAGTTRHDQPQLNAATSPAAAKVSGTPAQT